MVEKQSARLDSNTTQATPVILWTPQKTRLALIQPENTRGIHHLLILSADANESDEDVFLLPTWLTQAK